MDVRKWSVRKLRRRTRSCDNARRHKNKAVNKNNASNDDISKTKIREVDESSISTVKTDESAGSSGRGSLRRNRSSILLFGSELDKQPLDGSLDLSSDQDSTGGEDEDTIGMFFYWHF